MQAIIVCWLIIFAIRKSVPFMRLVSGETAKIRRCLVNGFFSNAAKLHFSGTYRTVKEDYPMKVYKGSTIMYRKEYPQWLVAIFL